MKKHLNSIALFLVVTLLTVSIVACNGDGAPSTTSTTPNSEENNPTLRILMGNSQNIDMATDPTVKLIEQVSGYTLKFDYISGEPSEEITNLALLLASGETYDLIKLSSGAEVGAFADKGYFAELDELLDQYGKNIVDNTDPRWWNACTFDGKIIGIPIKRSSAACIVGPIYRKDIFDKYKIAVPQTTDDFKTMLQTLKDVSGMIPYTFNVADPIIPMVSSAFGFTSMIGNNWYMLDGKIVPRVKMPGYKAYLQYVSDLYKSGLIDNEFAANTEEIVQTKMAAGQSAIASWAWWWWGSNDAILENAGAQIGYLSPLKAADGSSMAWLWGASPDWASVIPKSSKNAVHVMKFLNKIAENENFENIYLGEEGVYYINQDGVNVPTDKFTADKKNAWMSLFASNENYRAKFEEISYAGENPQVAATFTGMREAAKDAATLDPTANIPAVPEQTQYGTTLNQLESDFVTQVTSGIRSPDDYDDFIKQWDTSGGETLTKAWNDAYAAMKK